MLFSISRYSKQLHKVLRLQSIKERKNSKYQHDFVCHSFNSDNAKIHSILFLFFFVCRHCKNKNVLDLSFYMSYSKFCAWIAPTVAILVQLLYHYY